MVFHSFLLSSPDFVLTQREEQLTSFGFFVFYLSSSPGFFLNQREEQLTSLVLFSCLIFRVPTVFFVSQRERNNYFFWILRYFFCELARNLRRKSKIRDQKMLWNEKHNTEKTKIKTQEKQNTLLQNQKNKNRKNQKNRG